MLYRDPGTPPKSILNSEKTTRVLVVAHGVISDAGENCAF